MQSLALDIQVISEDGGEVEVREEDDELLRAAEELGIDLSPGSLRGIGGLDPAEAVSEDEAPDPVDTDTDVVLPADEALDLDDVLIEVGVDDDDDEDAPVGALDDDAIDLED
jgi:DNA-directed RNA polymerase subunit beta